MNIPYYHIYSQRELNVIKEVLNAKFESPSTHKYSGGRDGEYVYVRGQALTWSAADPAFINRSNSYGDRYVENSIKKLIAKTFL